MQSRLSHHLSILQTAVILTAIVLLAACSSTSETVVNRPVRKAPPAMKADAPRATMDRGTTKGWPQWRGPARDGSSAETGLIDSWPEAGPKVVWRVPSGSGYSGMSIVGDRLFTMWGESGSELLVCIDVKTGERVWQHRVDHEFGNDQGNGSRTTPLVDGELVYTVSAGGKLHAVRAATGEPVWQINMTEKFNTRIPRWGYSGSPLIERNMLLIETGGGKGKAFAALNKRTGEVVWMAGDDGIGYSSPVAVNLHGKRQVVFFSGDGLTGLAISSGEQLWHYPWKTSYDVNAALPLFIAPDKFYISSSYGVGAAMVQVTKQAGGSYKADTAWKTRIMKNHFNTSVIHEGHIYGFDDRIFKCLDAATGEEKWKTRGFQKGSLILAEGKLIVLGERGKLALVEASPEAYMPKSTFQILRGKCWTAPTLADGLVYVRNQKEMLCLDFRS